MEIPQQLLKPEFWLERRKKILADGRIGSAECDAWSIKTYRLLEEEGLSDFVEAVVLADKRIPELKRTRLHFHKWLEVRNGRERIFVADGTAGQFFPEYSLGFYGLFQDIPESMKEFYNRRAMIDTPEKNLYSRIIAERNRTYSPVYFR